MRFIREMASAALGVACLAATVRSQGPNGASSGPSAGSTNGSKTLSSRVEVDYQQSYVDSAGSRTDWMEYVILWRGQPGWPSAVQTNQADRAASLRAWEEARRAALAANHGFSGSGGANPRWVEIDNAKRHLYVVGRDFALPPRGSTLVVLIDRIDRMGGSPVVVSVAVVDAQFTLEARPKTWTSGDTTFTVRPSKNGIDAFLETLNGDPSVGAFISEAVRSPN